tara:strand:+ start:369 stop:617 length:249 start_codon:yes stop_codon:yes gene_type:complete
MNEKMFRDYIRLQSELQESKLKNAELLHNITHLEDHQRDLYEILDEKSKDIADLDQQLIEVARTLEKIKSWTGYLKPIKSEG